MSFFVGKERENTVAVNKEAISNEFSTLGRLFGLFAGGAGNKLPLWLFGFLY